MKRRNIFQGGKEKVLLIKKPLCDETVQGFIVRKSHDHKAIPWTVHWKLIIDFFRGLENLHADRGTISAISVPLQCTGLRNQSVH